MLLEKLAEKLWTPGTARGDRAGGGVSGLAGGELHHRSDAARQWRDVHGLERPWVLY